MSGYDYQIGQYVVVSNVLPEPRLPIIGIVEARYDSSLWVRCVTGVRADGSWPHVMPHIDHVKPAVWCENGEHWSDTPVKGDYLCPICRDAHTQADKFCAL